MGDMTTTDQPSDATTARSPGITYQQLLDSDTHPVPDVLRLEAARYLGSGDIPRERYTSRAWHDLEVERLWSRVWQFACRDEHIPEPGDYYVYDVGDRSALIVRGPDGSVKAFHNACLHRGTQLKPPASNGYSPRLRCPFHGWTWSLDGELLDLPCEWDFPHVDAEEFRLPEIRVGRWGGFVFVNFDDDAPPLDEYLGVLPEHFADWDLAERYVEVHIRKRLPANWKAAAGAFLEAYHVLETHSQTIYTAGDANAQYDVFGDNVTRFVHTIATTSPHVPPEKRPDEQRMLDMMMMRKDPGEDVPRIPEGQRARDVYARWVQDTLGEAYDNDFSDMSVTQTIDSIQYHVFPNAFFFPGLHIPLAYRFRPDGPDPDRSLFEVLYLRPHPRSGKVPEPAEPVDLDVDDSYTTVPGLPASLGAVLDQDTTNLAAQTRGFKASKKRGQTLGNYQEVRTRHFHSMVRHYIDRGDRAPNPTT